MLSTLDTSILNGIDAEIAQRVALLNVTATRLSPGETDADEAEGRARVRHLRRGSNVLATVKLTANAGDGDATNRLDGAARLVDDFWRARTNEQTVEQMAARIGQAYDQAHLLFNLARIPENAAACKAALADAMDRLHGITELGWVVLHFTNGDVATESLRGQQFLVGEPPVSLERFNALLSAAAAAEIPHAIQTPEKSELARATGAEVLLQPLTFAGRRLGVLAAGNNGGSDPGLSSFETQLFAACAGYLDTFHANLARIALQEQMFLGTLRALTASIDAKDPYTCGHSERVALLAQDVARACGFDETTAERYRIAGLIHDIGKIGVPERVLCKAGRLNDEEFGHIRKHPQIGFDILRDIPGLDDVRPGVLHHHERYDGTGYPHGLQGEAIPHMARVLALADTFDAMSSNRSYRAKLPRDHVLAELTRCAGGQFDPGLAAIFVRMDFGRFDAALCSHAEQFPSAPVVFTPAA